jgi:hypothetical protein
LSPGLHPGRRFRAFELDEGLAAGDDRVGAGEVEPGLLAHQAPAAVAADEPAGPHGLAAEGDGHPVGPGLEPGQLDAAAQVDAQFGGAVAEHLLELLLRNQHQVAGRTGFAERRIRPVDVLPADRDPGELPGRPGRRLAPQGRAGHPPEHLLHLFGRRPLLCGQGGQQSPPVHRLRGGHADPTGFDRRVDFGEPFHDQHVHPGEPKLASQHQADRSTPGDHHIRFHDPDGGANPVPVQRFAGSISRRAAFTGPCRRGNS